MSQNQTDPVDVVIDRKPPVRPLMGQPVVIAALHDIPPIGSQRRRKNGPPIGRRPARVVDVNEDGSCEVEITYRDGDPKLETQFINRLRVYQPAPEGGRPLEASGEVIWLETIPGAFGGQGDGVLSADNAASIRSLDERLAELKGSVKQQLGEIQPELIKQTAEAGVTRANAVGKQLKQRLDELDEKIGELAARLDEQDQRITQLAGRIDAKPPVKKKAAAKAEAATGS